MNSSTITYGLVEKVVTLPKTSVDDIQQYRVHFKFGSAHITATDLTAVVGCMVGVDSHGNWWTQNAVTKICDEK